MQVPKIAINESLEIMLNDFLEAAHSAGLSSTEVQMLVSKKYREKYLTKNQSPLTLSQDDQIFLDKAKNYLNKCKSAELEEQIIISPKRKTEPEAKKIITKKDLVIIIALLTFHMLNCEHTEKIGTVEIKKEFQKYCNLIYPDNKMCSIRQELDSSIEYLETLTMNHTLSDYPIPESWKKINLKNKAIYAVTLVAMIMFDK